MYTLIEDYEDLSSSGDFSSLSKAYEIDFEETPFVGGAAVFPPEVCWKTCQLVYPNTSLALVTLINGGLSCYCATDDTLTPDVLGPSKFCNQDCGHVQDTSSPLSSSSFCGGEHLFKNGAKEQYASIYCIPGKQLTRQR